MSKISEFLLEIQNLHITYPRISGKVVAVKGMNVSLRKSEIVALVGESGCGKSTLARSIILPTGTIERGKILFQGEDLREKSEREMQAIRGKKISIIFQDPLGALNPTLRIGKQVLEGLKQHEPFTKSQAKKRVLELLRSVGITEPQLRINQYPFELSGGLCQRVVIAMAIACRPLLLIADEPTTGLDVTIQAQILELFQTIRQELDSSILFITHDLGVVARLCDRVIVMHQGCEVENGSVNQIFYNPSHPYTRRLLEASKR